MGLFERRVLYSGRPKQNRAPGVMPLGQPALLSDVASSNVVKIIVQVKAGKTFLEGRLVAELNTGAVIGMHVGVAPQWRDWYC